MGFPGPLLTDHWLSLMRSLNPPPRATRKGSEVIGKTVHHTIA